MIRYFLISIFLVVVGSASSAQCNFKTGEFIEEMGDPGAIVQMEIEVFKSAKYAKNLMKTILSSSDNIPPKLRIRFKAAVKVHYNFGVCEYSSTIRQSGDWKDHIQFLPGGILVRSLDVKLKEGNVMGAVRFKLLIPETRGDINEVLAALILKNAGFISPETFEIDTIVNGIQARMLFQETVRKETLEKNSRRESAIFEGDEELVWSYKNFVVGALEQISLSRMENSNWFLKGRTSEEISLRAYSKLQHSYLEYSRSNSEKMFVFPNGHANNTFANYYFTLLAMNGVHALRPHNQKFYFNAITSSFEPIYYDGDVKFESLAEVQMGRDLNKILPIVFKHAVDESFVSRVQEIAKSDQLEAEFLQRVKGPKETSLKFLGSAIIIFSNNIRQLDDRIKFTPTSKRSVETKPYLIEEYEKRQNKLGVEQKLISRVEIKKNNYLVTLTSADVVTLSSKDMAEVISNNTFRYERVVLLNLQNYSFQNKAEAKLLQGFPGEVFVAPGIQIKLDVAEKLITFSQSKADDWVLIKSANLNEWKIQFDGAEVTKNHAEKSKQRFNKFGLTGCLTIYSSIFENTQIVVDGGYCEDSLNILGSTGNLDSISVKQASADAVDIDFSTIEIGKLQVSDAGNDCFDVSGGDYSIENVQMMFCADKGISVGEASTLQVKDLKMTNVKIGVSSKDFSKVQIQNGLMKHTIICAESMQKKQEFGGAQLVFNELDCEGTNNIDANSVLTVGFQ